MQRRGKKAGLLAQLQGFLNLAGKQEIGIGTFAQVFKVLDKRDHTYKALRQLQKSKQTIQQIQQQREINQKLMKINHPNILKVFEIFEDEELICYLTQYCEGGSLWDTLNFIKGKKFTEVEAVQIILQTAKAVNVLHDHGITHRDLKPQNILFVQEFQHNKKFHIKLADFGLSTNKMLMQTIAGTKQYIAPEQIRKDRYTKAVDIWALGIIFDELIHGVPFFTGDSHQETFHMIVNKDFRVRSDTVSVQTRNMLVRMIKRYPGQRPKIQQVVQKLEVILQSLTTESKIQDEKQLQKQIQFSDGRKSSSDIIDIDPNQEQLLQYNCSKHPQQVLLRQRKTKNTITCAKCIEQDSNIIPIEQYLKIIEQQNEQRRQYILKLKDFSYLTSYSLSGLAKNDKIHKQLQQRRENLKRDFTNLKSKYNFLNNQKVPEQSIQLLQKCVDQIKDSSDEYSKTLVNYKDLVLATVDSKIQKFLDNYFKDI